MAAKLTHQLAYSAGHDAGNRSARAASRKSWNEDDWNEATRITNQLLKSLRESLRPTSAR